jgi:ornithine cyclodeaminase/alanine dehydrogenase-like protein (mu-crystallin family)
VAAKHLARAAVRVATICGCGVQGRAHLDALRHVASLAQVYAYDVDPAVAAAFAADLDGLPPAAGLAVTGKPAHIAITATTDLPAAVAASGIVVTTTPARRFILEDSWVAPGSFVAAVGADSADKQEIDPALLARSRVVVDLLDQCTAFGDLRHALQGGALTAADVHAELHEIVAGTRPGRTSSEETFVFDSTGTALQDVAAAAAAYENARRLGIGTEIQLAG